MCVCVCVCVCVCALCGVCAYARTQYVLRVCGYMSHMCLCVGGLCVGV